MEWYKDAWETWIFWIPQKRILGTVKQQEDGMWLWEARVDHKYRLDENSIMGKSDSLRKAKGIVDQLTTMLCQRSRHRY